MSVTDSLTALARGERPAAADLAAACRLDAFGAEFFGEETIVASFRGAPLELAKGALWLTGAQSAAGFGHDEAGEPAALFADLYDGRIGRLWRIGPGEAPREAAVAVAFDADLHQQRGDVAWRAEDHPELEPRAAAAVEAAVRALVREPTGPVMHRLRGFVLRAFSTPGKDEAAALVAVHQIGAEEARSGGFTYAAVHVTAFAPQPKATAVWNGAPLAAWTPRI